MTDSEFSVESKTSKEKENFQKGRKSLESLEELLSDILEEKKTPKGDKKKFNRVKLPVKNISLFPSKLALALTFVFGLIFGALSFSLIGSKKPQSLPIKEMRSEIRSLRKEIKNLSENLEFEKFQLEDQNDPEDEIIEPLEDNDSSFEKLAPKELSQLNLNSETS